MTIIHGGNLRGLAEKSGLDRGEIVDFSASINPLGPPESLRRVISRNLEKVCHYPDPESTILQGIIADQLKVETQRIILGNGSTEILYAIPRALGRKKVLIPVPAYSEYAEAARLANLEINTLILSESRGFQLDPSDLATHLCGHEIVFMGQPNNPTGRLISRSALLDLVDSFTDTFFVIDESFAEFVPEYESVADHKAENLIVVRSLTKFYAIPGLRLGFGCASREIADRIRRFILPWSVNILAQEVGCAALQDKEYGERTRGHVSLLQKELTRQLNDLPELKVYPSEVNFLLVRITEEKRNAAWLAEKLLMEGLAIRVCNNFEGLPDGGRNFFRVAVRTAEENSRLVEALRNVLHSDSVVHHEKKKFSLMFQGTASNAGKSVLTAALCRILLQDGIRVAPFKAQNMSLNSYVTRDGLEMGRAQVVQAQACRLDPDVRMNPVLLKPSSDVGCQVIVNGLPAGNMSVDEYVKYKSSAWESVCTAFNSLSAEYDGVIIEGAGSPGEVNLKHHDIVNMRMARYANSPVLLVGDIDRGGVFASFVGTMEVLAEWERALVAGFIVNRFRGQESLLYDAFHYVEEHTGRKVLGVVQHLQQLGLPEEDSVSFKEGLYDSPPPDGECVEIGLIDLPHISNFTDFEPFLAEPDVHLKIIRNLADLEAAQERISALLLPGSKNVIADMEYLIFSGLDDLIRSMARTNRIEVVGICGGFQMLGGPIADPHGLESDGRGGTGLGLLDMRTTLSADKTLKRRTAVHLESGLGVYGYEIHHGRTSAEHKAVIADGSDRIGASSEDAMIWGSYLHGIFDSDAFRRWFIDSQRQRQGLDPIGKILAVYDLEPAFERLADTVRQGLDMEYIYRLLRL